MSKNITDEEFAKNVEVSFQPGVYTARIVHNGNVIVESSTDKTEAKEKVFNRINRKKITREDFDRLVELGEYHKVPLARITWDGLDSYRIALTHDEAKEKLFEYLTS